MCLFMITFILIKSNFSWNISVVSSLLQFLCFHSEEISRSFVLRLMLVLDSNWSVSVHHSDPVLFPPSAWAGCRILIKGQSEFDGSFEQRVRTCWCCVFVCQSAVSTFPADPRIQMGFYTGLYDKFCRSVTKTLNQFTPSATEMCPELLVLPGGPLQVNVTELIGRCGYFHVYEKQPKRSDESKTDLELLIWR